MMHGMYGIQQQCIRTLDLQTCVQYQMNMQELVQWFELTEERIVFV